MKCQKMKNNGRFCYRGNFFIYVLSLGEVIRRKYTSCFGFQNKTLKVNLYSQNVCANIKDVSFIYICPFSLRANSIFSQFIELEKTVSFPFIFSVYVLPFFENIFKNIFVLYGCYGRPHEVPPNVTCPTPWPKLHRI